jgi:CheY-like chemotaxis protein
MNIQFVQTPILVAEDNPADLFFLQRRLRTAGVMNPLQHAEDGVEAIKLLEPWCDPAADPALRPWLMFVDLRMPRLNGFDVLDWMNQRRLGDIITISVLSTSDEPEDLERAAALGAHRYLVKYPRPEELAEVVAFALRRAIERQSPAEAAHSERV